MVLREELLVVGKKSMWLVSPTHVTLAYKCSFILAFFSFEENPELGLLLQSLDTSRASPQQIKRLHMIQQIMAYKDPELMKQLLGLLSEGWNPMRDQDSLESVRKHQSW